MRATAAHLTFYFYDTGVFRAPRPTGPLARPAEVDGAALERFVAPDLRAWIAYSGPPPDLSYWRTRTGIEVDFVDHGNAHFYALDVNRVSREAAPRCGRGTAVDHVSDTLRAPMRSGHEHPFHSRTTTQQLIAARIAEAPKPVLDPLEALATRDIAVRRIATLARLCREKQPSARPASATELLTVMAAVHVSGSTSAPTTLVPKRVVIATIENKSGDAVLDPIGAKAADWIARGRLGTGIVDVGSTSANLASRIAASRATGHST